LARTKRGTALYSLHHVIDLDWMMEAYRLTRKDGAPGIDGVTAADYEVNLEANLLDLLDRIKSGRYRAPPVRRAYIPKADGSQKDARHSNLRRQGGATRRNNGAGRNL
jgi:RNA-directed DNA polymerase